MIRNFIIGLMIGMMFLSVSATSAPACYADSYVRDAGTIPGRPADCPDGYTNMGLTCYRGPKTIFAPSLVASCPLGFTNTGLTCFRFPETLSMKYMFCPNGYFKSVTGRCHKICPPEYTNTGEFCQRNPSSLGPRVMSCRDDEIKGGVANSRCYPKVGDCGESSEKSGALCYTKCRHQFYGVGPVCWSKCPTSLPYSCGATCVKNAGWCTNIVLGQVLSAGQLVATITTAGLASVFINAIQLNGFHISSISSVIATLVTNITVLNGVPQLMNLVRILRTIGVSAQEGNSTDNLTTTDIVRLAFQVISFIDITGASGVVAAYTFPLCSTQHNDHAPPAKVEGFCYPDPNNPTFYVLKTVDKPGWGPGEVCHAIDGTIAQYGQKPCNGGTREQCLEELIKLNH